MLRDFSGEPNRGQGDDRGQEDHDEAEAIETEDEIEPPLRADGERGEIAEAFMPAVESDEGGDGRERVQPGGDERGGARRCASQNDGGRQERTENEEEQDHFRRRRSR